MTGDAVPADASQAHPAYWTRLKSLFQGAIEQPAATRREWLTHASAGDAALLAHVERLLVSYEGIGDFLEGSASVDLADLLAAKSPAPEPDDGSGERDGGHDEAADSDSDGDDEPRWRPGERVGHYLIVEALGRGGMGVVHLAQDERLGRPVALKALPFAIAGRPGLRERLRREARAAATIAHPAVATVFALEEIDDHLFLVSEYVRGRSLRRLIDEGPLTPALARRIATSVAGGLAASHAAGVIHRDLKPDNIVVGEDGVAKIVDFGIAFIERDDGPRLTGSRHAVGTPAYMAPEQLLGLPVDARTDIYAFGVVLEEMLLGRHPLATAAASGTGRAATHRAAGARSGSGATTLAALAARCAQPAPEARYASAQELLADLSRASIEPDGSAAPDTLAPPARVDGGSLAAEGARVPSAAARPRWWWEFHQSAVALAYTAILVPLWVARGQIGGLPGRAIFAIGTGAVIVAAFIRCHLWFTSRFYPQELTWVRARVRGWIRAADWTFVTTLGLGALLLAERSPIDVVLLACAIGAAVAFLVIEPVTVRAAFGDAPPRDSTP